MAIRFLKDKYFCGLDIGAQTIKASLVRAQDQNNLELLGVYEVRTQGIKDSSISDLAELTESIQAVIQGLTQKTGVKIKNINLGIGGDLVTIRKTKTVLPLVERGNKVITPLDVRKVKYQARLLGVHLEEEVIDDFAEYFKVDENNWAINPVGMYGRKLEVSLFVVVCPIIKIRNIIKAVYQAGLEVIHRSYSSYAATEVILDAPLKKDGVIVLDIGASSTGFLVFKENVLRYVEIIPWGAKRVTQRIAEELNLGFDLAEEIKKSHAMAGEAPQEDDEILVKKESNYIPIPRQKICQAVSPEIDNFLNHVEAALTRSQLFHEINRGIVVAGGGSFLSGLMERIEKKFNMPVTSAMFSKGLNNSSVYAACVGLAKLNYTQDVSYKLAHNVPLHWTTVLTSKVKEVYQEYF